LAVHFGGLTAALAAVPVVWMMLPRYLQQRFLIAWHPETDIDNIGYQQYWGQQALRSGGVFGKGLFGHQENLIDVPECYNDFSFFPTSGRRWDLSAVR